MTTRFSFIPVVFTALAIMVLLGSCENAVQALDDPEPGKVQAGQGEQDGSIEVIWGEVTDSNGNEREAEEYEVFREKWDAAGGDGFNDPIPNTPVDTVDDTSYTDSGVENATTYRYWIRAVFPDSASCFLPCEGNDDREYAEGYALSAEDLTVHTEQNSSQGEQSFDASGSDHWFEFTAQQGWTYTIEISDTGGSNVEVYQRGDIVDPVHNDTGVGKTSFTADDTSVYHIRIPAGSGSGRISVSY